MGNEEQAQANAEMSEMLRTMREQMGLTQGQLADILSEVDSFVSVRTYQRYEAGETICPAWVFKRVELLRDSCVLFEKNDAPRKLFDQINISLIRQKIREFFN